MKLSAKRLFFFISESMSNEAATFILKTDSKGTEHLVQISVLGDTFLGSGHA